ncbi:hypothetical protein E2C01_072417 [Portunus trituberculatus]|uniref:Uncharacterized protein n=1 Tax=Portunus trituberculatus TaxID=210409 RepID=A0A5B7IAN9_PORTR|nr:hypothetical protein [Portunus trituberculatus]
MAHEEEEEEEKGKGREDGGRVIRIGEGKVKGSSSSNSSSSSSSSTHAGSPASPIKRQGLGGERRPLPPILSHLMTRQPLAGIGSCVTSSLKQLPEFSFPKHQRRHDTVPCPSIAHISSASIDTSCYCFPWRPMKCFMHPLPEGASWDPHSSLPSRTMLFTPSSAQVAPPLCGAPRTHGHREHENS